MPNDTRYTIRDIREMNYLTLAEFADKIGVSTLTVHKWEAAINEPQLKNLRKIAATFDVDIRTIDTGIDTRRNRRTS